MIWSILAQVFWLGLDVLGVLSQSEQERTIEVLVLRQQLRIVERKQRRAPRVSRWEKLTLAVLAARLKGRDRLTDVMLLFKPETVLKWHRELVRRKWIFQQAKRRAGQAALDPEVEALIVQLARDNPRLGYKKLVGELRKLGYRVGRSTVRDVLKRHHVRPAPERRRTGSTWRTFLNSHKAQLLATDFFHRRHGVAADRLRVILHGTAHPSSPSSRLYDPADRRLGHPTGPSTRLGASRQRTAAEALLDP